MARPKKEIGEKFVRQNISMEPDQLQRLIEHCQKEDRSMSWVIRKALDNYLIDFSCVSIHNDTQLNANLTM